jgi:hypothetical protein
MTRKVGCSCGAVNRVGFYWVSRRPKCGACGALLPEQVTLRVIRYVARSRIIPLVVGAGLIVIAWHPWTLNASDETQTRVQKVWDAYNQYGPPSKDTQQQQKTPDIRALIDQSRKMGASDDEIRAQMEKSPYLTDLWKKSDAAGIPRSNVFTHFGLGRATQGTAKTARVLSSKQGAASQDCSEKPQPITGVYQSFSDGDAEAPLTVRTEAGANYLVKLQDAASGADIVLFFIRGSEGLQARVPLGNFVLKYATGQFWCNDADLFGPDTVVNRAQDTFRFYRDGSRVIGNTIELIPQIGGNLDMHRIPRSQF